MISQDVGSKIGREGEREREAREGVRESECRVRVDKSAMKDVSRGS